jgi:hypothetical protein
MKRVIVVTLLIGLCGMGTTAAVAGQHGSEKNGCPSKTKYLRALSARDHNGVVTIHGHHALFFCTKDAEFIKTRHAAATFTIEKGASIKVYRNPLRPDSARPISARKFPHYLAKHQDENWYTFNGRATAITKLKPAFQS